MPIARLSQAFPGLLLFVVLALMAAMSGTGATLAPLTFGTVKLFAQTPMLDDFANLLMAIGAGPTAVYFWTLIAVFDLAAAGLVLFALLFWLFLALTFALPRLTGLAASSAHRTAMTAELFDLSGRRPLS